MTEPSGGGLLPPGESAGAAPPEGQARPEAEVHAFLIADVRGYTAFTQTRGDEGAARLAARFAEVARAVVEDNRGEVLELRGDEALCVFGSPRSAIRAAVALQHRFVDETVADPSLPLTVGIGLDAGEAVPVEGGYRGGALNVAARLCSLAHAGEVLASLEIVHLARRIDGVRFTERGKVELKGLDQPVHVVAVRSEERDTAQEITPFAPAPPAGAGRARRRPRTWVVIAGVAVAVVAAGIPLVLQRSAKGGTEIDPNSVGVVDPETGELSATISMPSRPGSITADAGSLWVSNPDAATVTRIDEDTQAVVDTIPVGGAPAGIAAGDGAVWVVGSAGPSVSRISPETNAVVAKIPVGNGPAGVAVAEGSVWVTNRLDGTVTRIDPARGKVVATIPVGQGPGGITAGFGSVWVANSGSNTLVRIDPETNAVSQSIGVGNGPTAVGASPDGVWVANGLDGTVSLIAPGTGSVSSVIQVGDGPSGIAFTNGAVWVANESDGTLSRVDPSSRVVDRTARIGSIPQGLETAGGSLWVTVRGTATSHRGGTLRLVSESSPKTLDPAVAYDSATWSILIMTGDGLVGFKRVGGADGLTLVPDLAVSLPSPTDGGRTYAFELRPGIEYSNGESLLATDFRRAVERGFRIGRSPTAYFFGGLVGGRACSEDPGSCDLSEGIVTDDASGTVTFHLVEPDPEFLYKLALPFGYPVPASTPVEEQALEGVPGTGPYRLDGPMTDEGLVLVRNEHFRQWSVTAQPDGNVDQIEWTFGGTPDEHVDAITNGEADFMFDSIPSSIPSGRLEDLRVRFAGQVHTYPQLTTFFLSLNTAVPPFDDVDVRRALNLAVDRERIVELSGGSGAAALTCQILPPNFPGYEPYCPYTVDPGPGGQWTAPDLEAAKRLVRRSGAAGTHVTFWYTPAFRETAEAQADYFVELLDELGFVADKKLTGTTFDEHFQAIYDSSRGIQVAPSGWIADYPAASNFIATQLTCASFFPDDPVQNGNSAAFCDPDIDVMIERATEIQTEDPAAAGEAWAEVDRAITDQAPYVSLINPIGTDFLSERLGNYQRNPEWGLLLSQVWVR